MIASYDMPGSGDLNFNVFCLKAEAIRRNILKLKCRNWAPNQIKTLLIIDSNA